jgi:hypothetical protein
MKVKKKNKALEQVKIARKASREEEIATHGKAINYRKIMESKKVYNRKKNKADADEALPYFFYSERVTLSHPLTKDCYQILTRFSGFTYIGLLA